MEGWSPVTVFLLQYAFSGVAALSVLLMKKKALSVGETLGWTLFYSLVGGSFSPLCRELPMFPAALTKTERTLAASVAIGGGLVSIPELKKFAARVLLAGVSNDGTNNANQPHDDNQSDRSSS